MGGLGDPILKICWFGDKLGSLWTRPTLPRADCDCTECGAGDKTGGDSERLLDGGNVHEKLGPSVTKPRSAASVGIIDLSSGVDSVVCAVL